jgi:hypothetical protein
VHHFCCAPGSGVDPASEGGYTSTPSFIPLRDLPLKTFRSAREVIGKVDKLLADTPPSPHSPTALDLVAEWLAQARNYSWIGIYLVVGERREPAGPAGSAQPTTRVLSNLAEDPSYRASSPESRSAIAVPIRIAGKVLGITNVEGPKTNGFGSEERILLEQVAARLARYLVGPGKFLLRKARERATQAAPIEPVRGIQPSSEKAPAEKQRAAAGEKSR